MRQVKSSRDYPLLNDEGWVRQRYEVEEKIMKEVAELAGGCSVALVLHALRRFGIKSRKGKAALRGKKTKLPSFPELYDRAWLAERRAQGLSGTAIAGLLGCSVAAACKAVRNAGLVEPEPADITTSPYYGQAWRVRDEEWLADQYLIRDRKAKNIAAELGVTVWAVQKAVGLFRILKYPDRPQRKGRDDGLPPGTKRTPEGYIKVRRPNHKYADPKGWVFQHRIVCEAALERHLTKEEQVHHINERRDDNRPENLLVVPNYSTHCKLHQNQPPWVPRCGCCGRPQPELITGRPSWVPLVYDEAAVYSPGPADAPDYCI